MRKRKGYSEKMKFLYSFEIRCILEELKNGEQVYTHRFESTFSNGIRHWEFVGKSNRPHLLKCLWSLEEDGLIENINLGNNIYQWKINHQLTKPYKPLQKRKARGKFGSS